MNVQSGATVAFITVLGGIGGAMAGTLVDALVGTSSKEAPKVVAFAAALGALSGAFIGGTIMTPDAASSGTGTARPLLPPTG